MEEVMQWLICFPDCAAKTIPGQKLHHLLIAMLGNAKLFDWGYTRSLFCTVSNAAYKRTVKGNIPNQRHFWHGEVPYACLPEEFSWGSFAHF